MEKYNVNKTVNKIERSAFLSDRIYALTLSSNHARHVNAYKAYRHVIRQLPTGTFKYVREISRYNKYHIHGIMSFKYKFNYFNLKEALVTSDGFGFDIHIEYKKISTVEDYNEWFNYSSKHRPRWREHLCDDENIGVLNIPKTCIPEVKLIQVVKPLRIPGIY